MRDVYIVFQTDTLRRLTAEQMIMRRATIGIQALSDA